MEGGPRERVNPIKGTPQGLPASATSKQCSLQAGVLGVIAAGKRGLLQPQVSRMGEDPGSGTGEAMPFPLDEALLSHPAHPSGSKRLFVVS